MSQHREENLNVLDFQNQLNLEGNIRVLREEKGFPTVFLMDENHDNLNNCINKNITNTIELIKKGNVVIVGVECLAGGRSWDSQNMLYSEEYFNKKLDDMFAKEYTSSNMKFIDGLKTKYSSVIFGVESFGMVHKMGEDLSEVGQYYGTPVSDHPLNIERSKHFIRTLFDHYHFNNFKGNLILNCGSHHNRDIEKWIESNMIENIANQKASYIRINTID